MYTLRNISQLIFQQIKYIMIYIYMIYNYTICTVIEYCTHISLPYLPAVLQSVLMTHLLIALLTSELLCCCVTAPTWIRFTTYFTADHLTCHSRKSTSGTNTINDDLLQTIGTMQCKAEMLLVTPACDKSTCLLWNGLM